jgi:hypothetical protein
MRVSGTHRAQLVRRAARRLGAGAAGAARRRPPAAGGSLGITNASISRDTR